MSNAVQQAKARAIRGELERKDMMLPGYNTRLQNVIDGSIGEMESHKILAAGYQALGYRTPQVAATSAHPAAPIMPQE